MSAATQIHTSIIVPTHNQATMLIRLVDGLEKTALRFGKPLELIIVDNNSDEPELLRFLDDLKQRGPSTAFSAVQVLAYPRKFNYSAINNMAVTKSQGKHLCFLNNDIEIIDANWLSELHKPLAHANTGCVGAMLYYPDDTIQHAGVFLDAANIAGHLYKHEPRGSTGQNNFMLKDQVVSAVTAACMLVSRKAFDHVHGFDEALTVAFNDVDFCLKLNRAGFKNIWTPNAELYHHESKSRGLSHQRSFLQRLNHKKEVFLMKRRWRCELKREQHHFGPDDKSGHKRLA